MDTTASMEYGHCYQHAAQSPCNHAYRNDETQRYQCSCSCLFMNTSHAVIHFVLPLARSARIAAVRTLPYPSS